MKRQFMVTFDTETQVWSQEPIYHGSNETDKKWCDKQVATFIEDANKGVMTGWKGMFDAFETRRELIALAKAKGVKFKESHE